MVARYTGIGARRDTGLSRPQSMTDRRLHRESPGFHDVGLSSSDFQWLVTSILQDWHAMSTRTLFIGLAVNTHTTSVPTARPPLSQQSPCPPTSSSAHSLELSLALSENSIFHFSDFPIGLHLCPATKWICILPSITIICLYPLFPLSF